MPETDVPTVLPGFSIELGSPWSAVDLSQLPEPEQLAEAFDGLVADGELEEAAITELLPVLTNAIDAARRSRVSFMAFLAASDDEYGAILATLTVSYAVASDALSAPAGRSGARRRPSAERRTIDVGGVEAVRLADIIDVPVAPGIRQRVRSVQYLVPTDDPSVGVVATATSSAIELAHVLDAVFDHALSTLRVERG